MNNERITAKLQKLLALARSGVGGEKDNAQRMLDNMLRKAGMTIADLDDEHEAPQLKTFAYKSLAERSLLMQCVVSVLDRKFDAFKRRGVRGQLLIELTRAEHIEIDVLFSAHRKALAKHLAKTAKNALSAYIHTNRIYSKTPNDDDTPSTLSPEDLAAIMGMMRNMDPTPVHRQIAA